MYKSFPRFVQLRRLLFRSEFDCLMANCWVTFFAGMLACKNFGKASNKDLNTFLYILWFKMAPRAYLFWLKNYKSDLSTTRTCLAFFSVGITWWAVTEARDANSILWKVLEASLWSFICRLASKLMMNNQLVKVATCS